MRIFTSIMLLCSVSYCIRARLSLAFAPTSLSLQVPCISSIRDLGPKHEHGLRRLHVLSSSPSSTSGIGMEVDNSINTGASPLPMRTKSIKGIIFDMDGTLIQPCIDFEEMRRRIYDIADNDAFLAHADVPAHARRGDVLELYKTFSPEGQEAAKVVFDDIEARALNDMMLMPYIGELCHFLDERNIARAVLTRNVKRSIDAMQRKIRDAYECNNDYNIKKEFHPVVHRETMVMDGNDGGPRVLEMKPSPDAILHICHNVWGCDPKDVLMVGDSAADDIVAANRAGCGGSVLLNFNGLEWDNDSGGGDVDAVACDDVDGNEGIIDHDEVKVRRYREERQPSLIIHDLRELKEILERH